jgi:hypothetical protein
VFVEFIMTTPTKGVYASKRWAVSEITEGVRPDGSKRLTLCIRRKRKTSEEQQEKKRKNMESLTEQVQKSPEEKREERKFNALARELISLNPQPQPTAKPVRAAAVTKLGALSEEAVASRDYGTRGLADMIGGGVLAEDDMQTLHAPLSGRDGRARVKTAHEKSMYRQGVWTDNVTDFTKKGVSKTPSQRVAESESGSSDEEVDTWVQCERCSKWRIWRNQCVPAHFFCCDQPGKTCATPQDPWD